MKILFMDNLSLSPALLSGQCNFLDFTRDILVSASVSEHQMVSCTIDFSALVGLRIVCEHMVLMMVTSIK